MASRLASGGINLAASASSHHVSAAAGPDVNYCRPTEEGGRDETKQDACKEGGGGTSVSTVYIFTERRISLRFLLVFFFFFFFFFSPLLHE